MFCPSFNFSLSVFAAACPSKMFSSGESGGVFYFYLDVTFSSPLLGKCGICLDGLDRLDV